MTQVLEKERGMIETEAADEYSAPAVRGSNAVDDNVGIMAVARVCTRKSTRTHLKEFRQIEPVQAVEDARHGLQRVVQGHLGGLRSA